MRWKKYWESRMKMKRDKIVIGSRESKLAVLQSEMVRDYIKEKNPDTGIAHQAARQGSDRSRTCLHAVESGIGNLQPSRQEQAFG